MADIFLSYARPNARAANSIAEALSARGYSVWFDAELPAHRSYAEVIEEQLEAASAVIVLWSKDSIGSQWVRSEANRARETGRLVQARVDDARLPMPFDQIQCADLSGATENVESSSGWRTLLRSTLALAPEPMPRAEPKPTAVPSAPRTSRRGLIIGGGVVAAAAAVGGGWWLVGRIDSGPAVSPETAALMLQAKGALWQNTPEGQNQAIGIYRQVAADNPQFAEAWGRLAMAYALTAHWRGEVEAAALWERARSAGDHALSINPHDVHALTGVAVAKPFQGHWTPITRDLKKALTYEPRDGETNFCLALILSMGGYVREGLDHVGALLRSGPTPGIYVWNAQMLWSAGRQEELDTLLDEATKLYPTHFGVWFTRFYTEMMGGRPQAALAFAADTAQLPTGIDSEEIDAVVRVAKAIQSRSTPDAEAVVREWFDRAHRGAGYAENAAQFMSSLGRVDDALAVLRAYFFAEGFDPGERRFGGTIGAYTARNDRQTAFLFNPAMANVRADPRFVTFTKKLKLTDYWQASGRKPDYLS